jgi:hypothetical protein
VTGEEAHGVVAAVTNLGRTALTSIPPAFLVLCAINAAFVGGLMVFLDRQSDARERVLSQIITACLDDK